MAEQNLSGVALHGLDRQIMGERDASALHDESTPVLERERISRQSMSNFTVDNVPAIRDYLERRDSMPAWMSEKSDRRAAWNFLFEGADSNAKSIAMFRDGQNAALRRHTEIALDNTLKWLVETWLPNEKYSGLNEVKRMTPEDFCTHFLESADVVQYPAQVLGLVRQLVPMLISRQLFSYFSTDTVAARIPVLEYLYGQDHAPFTIDGTDLLFLTPTVNDFYYSGGEVTGLEIGTGDAVVVNFDLPISETRSHIVYLDGVETTAFAVGVGAGAGGRDRIEMNAAPGNGVIVSVSFTTSVVKGEAGREVDGSIRMVQLTDDSMTLTARWDLVDEQDAMSFHNIQLSPEMNRGMMDKINQDLEAHVIRNALQQATGGDAIWLTDGYAAMDNTSSERFAYEETINELFVEAAQFLFKRYGRYPTWVVVGEDIATRLNKLKKFRAWPLSAESQQLGLESTGGQVPIGIFENRWIVYQSPAGMPATRMLMGWTPATPFDVTYAVGIYLPFYTTGPIQDGQGRLRKYQTNLMRYGEAVVKPTQLATGTLQTTT